MDVDNSFLLQLLNESKDHSLRELYPYAYPESKGGILNAWTEAMSHHPQECVSFYHKYYFNNTVFHTKHYDEKERLEIFNAFHHKGNFDFTYRLENTNSFWWERPIKDLPTHLLFANETLNQTRKNVLQPLFDKQGLSIGISRSIQSQFERASSLFRDNPAHFETISTHFFSWINDSPMTEVWKKNMATSAFRYLFQCLPSQSCSASAQEQFLKEFEKLTPSHYENIANDLCFEDLTETTSTEPLKQSFQNNPVFKKIFTHLIDQWNVGDDHKKMFASKISTLLLHLNEPTQPKNSKSKAL
jgi:hypothetical protein